MTETALKHNFIDQSILDAGGFTVQLRVNEINSSTVDLENRYVGFGVGLSGAEAQASNDISGNTSPYSFRGNGATPGTADFFIELDLGGNVKVWSNGLLLETIPVGKISGTLTAAFEFDSFASGSIVTVTAFMDEQLIDLNSSGAGVTRTFVWENSGANFIGLSARASSYVAMDNFAVRLLPFSDSLASEYLLDAGLSGSDAALEADPDQDGTVNLAEFAIGSDPSVADSDARAIQWAAQADGLMELDMRRHVDYAAIGLQYRAQYCSNLVDAIWTDVSYSELSSEIVPDNTGYETVRIALPEALVMNSSNLFVRAVYQ